MPAIALNQASDCSNPLIDVFIIRETSGVSIDVAELEWRILDLTGGEPGVQVEPAGPGPTFTAANVAACPTGDRLSLGRYVMNFTIPGGFNVGTHRIEWRFREVLLGTQFKSLEEFEVLDIPIGVGGDDVYATVQSMRDEGLTVAQADDATVLQRLTDASRIIDNVTGRFFIPHTDEYFLDGSGHSKLFLQQPIIAITEIEITVEGINFTDQPIDLNDVAIFNRHLSQNLRRPDDRDHPQIAFKSADPEFARLHALLGQRVFYEGQQNIRVSGLFGYTDFDGTSTGKTPDLIARATRMIAFQNMAPLSDPDASFDAANSNNIRRLKTRDQEVEYQNKKLVGGLTEGPFTGDIRIDNLLLMFMRPMDIAAV